MTTPWETLKLLADTTRVRILRLVSRDELAVTEIQDILEMGQSRISSHLALLRSADLVLDRRDGKKTFYSLHPELPVALRGVLDAAFESVAREPEVKADAKAFARVIERRRHAAEEYFNAVAGRLGKNHCPGRSWEAVGHMLFRLIPRVRIADLGAGEGVLSQLLARRAEFVHCIDNSPKMVEFGRKLAAQHGIANLEYKLGDMADVPLPDASVDIALLSQALHHAPNPDRALAEAHRILKPGGQAVILDLRRHGFEKARELYADYWLGFSENALAEMMTKAGFKGVSVEVVARETEEPCFETLLACGEKR